MNKKLTVVFLCSCHLFAQDWISSELEWNKLNPNEVCDYLDPHQGFDAHLNPSGESPSEREIHIARWGSYHCYRLQKLYDVYQQLIKDITNLENQIYRLKKDSKNELESITQRLDSLEEQTKKNTTDIANYKR